jgi:hypothetical protein
LAKAGKNIKICKPPPKSSNFYIKNGIGREPATGDEHHILVIKPCGEKISEGSVYETLPICKSSHQNQTISITETKTCAKGIVIDALQIEKKKDICKAGAIHYSVVSRQ